MLCQLLVGIKGTCDMSLFTDEQLVAMLDDLESDLVERKRNFEGEVREKARQAVCAFANDLPNHNRPGVLFLGAEDDGSPSNLEISDNLLLALADIKTDGQILPLPALFVEKKTLKGAEMAVVSVLPSDMPPVKYKGRIWIRIGPRRGYACDQDERILCEKRLHKSIPFDLQSIPSSTTNDLSKSLFENEYLPANFPADVLATDARTYEERLSSCRMIVSTTDTTPTILGILTLGKTPQDYLPGAYIQFLRIDGEELCDRVSDQQIIDGTLSEMLRRTDEKLKAHNNISLDMLSSSTHIVDAQYPLPALQQILYNAVLHRTYERTNAPVRIYWYNDRIEIHSPGGPFGNVTIENFGQPGITDYRNPNIAAALKAYGFVQSFGRGIATARKEMGRNGNPAPTFEVNESAIVCTLRRKST